MKSKIDFKNNMYLGNLCIRKHMYLNTGKSLRYIRNRACVACLRERWKSVV